MKKLLAVLLLAPSAALASDEGYFDRYNRDLETRLAVERQAQASRDAYESERRLEAVLRPEPVPSPEPRDYRPLRMLDEGKADLYP